MKRFHVHVAVSDLEQSIRFYSTLFGGEPSVRKADYAKWMLDDPRVNFAISLRGGTAGVNHLGLQVDTADELEAHARTTAGRGPGIGRGKGRQLLLRAFGQVLGHRSSRDCVGDLS